MITVNIFSHETVNFGRQTEVDLTRGFSAILIIIVHIGLFLGNGISKGLWTFCDIAGSEPCAPVLMALMGICMAYSRHQRPAELSKRGIHLFAVGYILNFFRSLLPHVILGNVDEWASIEAFFVVDILQFAGLSFMLIALLKQFRLPDIGIWTLSIAMVTIDQFIMLPDAIPWNSELLTGIVNLFFPTSSWSCFPLLTWFFFPASGLLYGDFLRCCTNKKKLYGFLLPVCAFGSAYVYCQFYSLYPDYTNYYWGNNFYYMGLKNTFLTLPIIYFFLSFWFFVEGILPDALKKWLVFLSVNLNPYYVISWIIISILIHAQSLGKWKFGTWLTSGIMVLLVIVCAWITKLWLFLKEKCKKAFSESSH